MIQRDRATLAADELLAAALLSEGWETGLQRLADAAEAGGSTLTRLRNGCPLAVISSTSWVDADATMMAGGAPPSPRRFFPDHVFRDGFLGDTDVWPEEAFHRDPYFQEFLRPRGVFYHAKAQLAAESGERISLSLKRLSKFGPYEAADLATFRKCATKTKDGGGMWSRSPDGRGTYFCRPLRSPSSSSRIALR